MTDPTPTAQQVVDAGLARSQGEARRLIAGKSPKLDAMATPKHITPEELRELADHAERWEPGSGAIPALRKAADAIEAARNEGLETALMIVEAADTRFTNIPDAIRAEIKG